MGELEEGARSSVVGLIEEAFAAERVLVRRPEHAQGEYLAVVDRTGAVFRVVWSQMNACAGWLKLSVE